MLVCVVGRAWRGGLDVLGALLDLDGVLEEGAEGPHGTLDHLHLDGRDAELAERALGPAEQAGGGAGQDGRLGQLGDGHAVALLLPQQLLVPPQHLALDDQLGQALRLPRLHHAQLWWYRTDRRTA